MCERSNIPLDFIYERKTDRYALEKYKTNEDLVLKIRSGKGDEIFINNGLGKNLFIETFLGGNIQRHDGKQREGDLEN